MLPPPLQHQQQQQLSNHHQQQQQYMLTNPTYNNNGMMESANKTWPKDDRMLPTAPSAAALTQHESASSHMTNAASENVQWSSNLCNKPQGICQTKQQHQQQQLQPPTTTAAADNNNKEQQHQRQQMDRSC